MSLISKHTRTKIQKYQACLAKRIICILYHYLFCIFVMKMILCNIILLIWLFLNSKYPVFNKSSALIVFKCLSLSNLIDKNFKENNDTLNRLSSSSSYVVKMLWKFYLHNFFENVIFYQLNYYSLCAHSILGHLSAD